MDSIQMREAGLREQLSYLNEELSTMTLNYSTVLILTSMGYKILVFILYLGFSDI